MEAIKISLQPTWYLLIPPVKYVLMLQCNFIRNIYTYFTYVDVSIENIIRL